MTSGACSIFDHIRRFWILCTENSLSGVIHCITYTSPVMKEIRLLEPFCAYWIKQQKLEKSQHLSIGIITRVSAIETGANTKCHTLTMQSLAQQPGRQTKIYNETNGNDHLLKTKKHCNNDEWFTTRCTSYVLLSFGETHRTEYMIIISLWYEYASDWINIYSSFHLIGRRTNYLLIYFCLIESAFGILLVSTLSVVYQMQSHFSINIRFCIWYLCDNRSALYVANERQI